MPWPGPSPATRARSPPADDPLRALTLRYFFDKAGVHPSQEGQEPAE